MFNDVLIASERNRAREALALHASVAIHTAIIVGLILAPLITTGKLPEIVQKHDVILAPLPNLTPPLPLAARKAPSGRPDRIKPVQVHAAVQPGNLVAPVEIPDRIVESDDAGFGIPGGIEGGIEGGVEDGQYLGIVGDIIRGIAGDVEMPVRTAGGIRPPRLLKRVAPEYPEIARQARVQGVVVIEATTDVYGRVRDARILRSIPLLDQAALDAVRQWVYEPAVVSGRPRGVVFTVTLRFELK